MVSVLFLKARERFGPATANARSPNDARRVNGTTKMEVYAERSGRRMALQYVCLKSVVEDRFMLHCS